MTSVPIVAGFAYIVVAPLVFVVGASWWMIHPPIAFVLAASLWMVYRIVARPPVDADEIGKSHCAKDAIYGAIGFGLFYLLAWLGLVLFYLNMAPL